MFPDTLVVEIKHEPDSERRPGLESVRNFVLSNSILISFVRYSLRIFRNRANLRRRDKAAARFRETVIF